MSDLFNAKVLCDECNTKMEKAEVIKDGFKVRALVCNDCGKNYLHPDDEKKLDHFSKIRSKQFQVKLRMVGNSYTVSIPREIIDFEEEFNRELQELINITLEEPGRLSLFFNKKLGKIY